MPWRIRAGGPVGGPPIVADGVVYVPSTDNLVYAADAASGNLRWTYRRNQVRTLDVLPMDAIAVVGGTVFIGEVDSETGSSSLHAVDAHSGRLTWRRDLDRAGFEGTATDDAVLVHWRGELRCLDPADGSERWRYAHPALTEGAWMALVIADDTVICGASIIHPHRLFPEEGVVFAVGLADGRPRWHYDTDDYGFKLGARDGVVYGGTAGGQLWAVDVRSGEQLWASGFEPHSPDPSAGFSSAMTTPVVTDDWLYVGCGNGDTYRIDRGTGDWIHRWVSPARVEAVCHGGGVTFAALSDGAIVAYPGLEGDFLWWQRGPIGPIEGMTYADGTLFVSGGRHLAAFDATSGAPPWQWRLRTSRKVRSTEP